MIAPDEERQCRPVDPNHVDRLKTQYKRSTTSFVVLVGLLTEPDVDINRYLITGLSGRLLDRKDTLNNFLNMYNLYIISI